MIVFLVRQDEELGLFFVHGFLDRRKIVVRMDGFDFHLESFHAVIVDNHGVVLLAFCIVELLAVFVQLLDRRMIRKSEHQSCHA